MPSEDDLDHPIPYMRALDVFAEKRGGGGILGIIIASKLEADERSQQRLLDKIELYLAYINSADFEARCGTASPDNTTIEIVLRKGAAPEVYDLLNRCKPWVLENKASLTWGSS